MDRIPYSAEVKIPSVTVRYQIPEGEWRRSAEGRWESAEEPIGDLFEGEVEIFVSGESIFGPETYPISISNLAVGLASVYTNLKAGQNGEFKFYQLNDGLTMTFFVEEGHVRLSHNLAPGKEWHTSRVEVLAGLSTFIESFTGQVQARIPEGLDWKQLCRLKDYAKQQVPPP